MTAQIELSIETECSHDVREMYLDRARREAVQYALENGRVSSDVLTTVRPSNVHPNASGSIFRDSGLFRTVGFKKSQSATRKGGAIWVWELVDREKAVEFLYDKNVKK